MRLFWSRRAKQRKAADQPQADARAVDASKTMDRRPRSCYRSKHVPLLAIAMIPLLAVTMLATYRILYLGFHPGKSGHLLWWARVHVEFVEPPYMAAPKDTCFLTALNEEGRRKYAANLQVNRQWATFRGWKYFEYLQEEHPLPNNTTGILFLRFYGMQHLFEHEECELIVYLDGDAVVKDLSHVNSNVLPLGPGKEVVFGNELFVYAMHQVDRGKKRTGVLNS